MAVTRMTCWITASACALLAGLTPVSATADTLTETLIKTYQMSPALEAERAALRSVDENVALARSARRLRTSISSTADFSASDSNDWAVSDTYSASINNSLTLYDHGQSAAGIKSAEAVVALNRAILRSIEQDILLSAVAAFMDVRRDAQSVTVARNNVSVLREQVRATNDRFELGEVTRTDVSLSEARLASARANLAAFQGQLNLSNAQFEAVVGIPPSNLETPPPLPELPATLDEAEAIAINQHPALAAARFGQTAAEFDVTRARGARGPSVALGNNFSYLNNETIFGRSRTNSVGVSITGSVPIYEGGRLSSLVRQAEAVLAQRKFEVQDTARLIRQNVASAWSNLIVSRATIQANREEVRAARIAFEGVREEATLGARTTLDVLDLEQDLRDAEFQLNSARRDEYVAAYQLLSSMGLLSVTHLNLGIEVYNPDVNYNRVQNAPYSTVEGDILDQLRDRYSR